jgi:ATP diphosphatase
MDLPARGIDRLLAIMGRLRAPVGGCPWDVAQDFGTIAPYTIEEAYEVADAIERDDMSALRDELGDLLFQVVFHGRMAEERGLFDFDGIAAGCADKMIRRHPHVFGNESGIVTAEDQTIAWEAMKAAERAGKADVGVLAGVATGLPALTRAVKIQARAARVGFDWTSAPPILDKIEEEIGELRAELTETPDQARVEDELGDLLFALANLARRLEIDPERALRRATGKFERRFAHMEQGAGPDGLAGRDPAALEKLWESAKRAERQHAQARAQLP